ncbi:MAG: DapH/DapD/GlmU-related protein [Pseudomonadota bacterium]
MSNPIFAIGLGIGTQSNAGDWLEVFYSKLFQKNEKNAAAVDDFMRIIKENFDYTGGNATLSLENCDLISLIKTFKDTNHEGSATFCEDILLSASEDRAVICILETDVPAEDTPSAYLKLQLLSHRMIKPHGTDLSGIFAVLPNVAWTNQGAIALEDLHDRRMEARLLEEHLSVESIDKFPKMTDYVVPNGVRIADTARVRLGAYLGEGTTIMHEGFCNFNAGTEGTSMIEGRISAGVFVSEGSDLGGGCSTMGTLSGGNNVIISIGKNCLIGANAGVGIPLGDRCTVEAGLYVTAGSVVTILAKDGSTQTAKARDLANITDLLFRRNSISGAIEVLANGNAIELNSELHDNN